MIYTNCISIIIPDLESRGVKTLSQISKLEICAKYFFKILQNLKELVSLISHNLMLI